MPTLQLIIDGKAAKVGAAEFDAAVKQVQQGADKASQAAQNVNNSVEKSGGAMSALANQAKVLAASFAGVFAIKSVLSTLAGFETGIVGVAKTTDMAGEELKAFEEDVIRLSTTIPVGTSRLLEIGAAAGQLGVRGKDNIILFTDTIAKLGVASNLQGEDAATTLAQILNITGEGTGKIKQLADSIVALGNNSAVAGAEAQIAHIANEVARSTSVYKVNSSQAVALAAALGTMGVQAENAGTSAGKVFRTLSDAARNTDSAESQLIQTITGLTGEQLKKDFEANAAGVFQKFTEGLGKITDSGGNAAGVLDQLNLSDERLLKTMLPLASNSQLLAKAFKDVENSSGALDTEAGRAFGTLANQWELFKNNLAAGILQFRNSTGVLRDIMVVVNQAARIIVGLDQPSAATSKAVMLVVNAFKMLAAVGAVWLSLKVWENLKDSWTHTMNLAKSFNTANVMSKPLLTSVILIGAAVAGWAIGKTLFDDFEAVQRGAENIRHQFVAAGQAIAELTMAALKNPLGRIAVGNVARATGRGEEFDALMQNREAVGLAITQAKMTEDETHAARLAEIKKEFAEKPAVTAGDFFTHLRDNAINAITDMQKAIGEFGTKGIAQAIAKINKDIENGTAIKKSDAQATDTVSLSIDKMVKGLKEEQRLIGLNTVERQQLQAVMELEKQGSKEELERNAKKIQQLKDLIAYNAQLKAEADIKTQLDELKYEGTLLGLNNDEREIEIQKRNILAQSRREGVKVSQETTDEVDRTVRSLHEQEKAWKRANEVAQQFGDSVAGAFEDAIMGASSFSDSLIKLGQDIERLLIRTMITQPLSNFVSGLAGNFLGMIPGMPKPPTPAPHADGGLVMSATYFPTAGGGMGVMGERGAEAIMPVERMADGSLGIKSNGGGSTIVQHITINAKDADSFRRSERQIKASLRRAAGG